MNAKLSRPDGHATVQSGRKQAQSRVSELPTLASKKEEHCQARRTPSAANADRGELPNFENSEVT